MTAETQNPKSTNKKQSRWKYISGVIVKSWLILGALIVFILIATLPRAIPITLDFVSDYCYLESLKFTNEEIYAPRIQIEKSQKVPGWEERVKAMEEKAARPDPNETFLHHLITSFCPEPGAEKKPSWLSETPHESLKEQAE